MRTAKEIQADLESVQLRDQAAMAHAHLDAAELLLEWLGPRGLLGQKVADGSAALQQRVRDLLGDQSFHVKTGDREFDFGLEDGEVGFRSWRTLSAGEAASVLACFAAACIERSGAELKILQVDNLERLGADASDLVARLARLVQWGALDQVLAAGNAPLDPRAWEELPEAAPVKVVEVGA